jgi:hypothetical protein
VPKRVRGDRAFVNLIKKLPDAAKAEVVELLQETGAQVLTEQRAMVKKRTGALSRALSMKVLPKSMRLQVGLVGKPINRKLFYGRIIQSGRKAQTVRARKRGGKPYLMKIRGTAPHNFIYPYTREQLAAPFKSLWDRILKRTAGAGDE